jgi:hypothetical protein
MGSSDHPGKLGKDFRIVLWIVAEPKGVAVVPPGAGVARDAVDDLEDVIRREADLQEPLQVGI